MATLSPRVKRLDYNVETIACCVHCEEPKFPQDHVKLITRPGCVNPSCIMFGEPQASVALLTPTELVFALHERLQLLRKYLESEGYEFSHHIVE